MTGEKDSENGEGVPNKLLLTLPKRVPVETTLGLLYARHLSLGDLKSFNAYLDPKAEKVTTDLRALGELALRTLVTEHSETDRTPGLTEDVYSELDSGDIQRLAAGVAQACELGELRSNDALEALGSAMFDHLTEQVKRVAESAQQMKKMLDQQFGTISGSARKSLESSLGGLSALRDSLQQSSAFEAFRNLQEEQAWRKKLVEGVGGATTALDAIRRFEEKQTRFTQGIPQDLLSKLQHGTAEPIAPIIPNYNSHIHFPKVEETPMGRAAKASEESALQLKEVAGITAQLADRVAEVTQVVMTKVLPEWFRHLSESANASKTTFHQAEQSLRWAKWALIGSIIVTVAMTGWQIRVGGEYKLDNDKQQNRMELLLARQLQESKRLNQHLSDEIKQLREAIVHLGPAPASSQPAVHTKLDHKKAQR